MNTAAETTVIMQRLTRKRMSITRRRDRKLRNCLIDPEESLSSSTDENPQSGR